MCPLCDVSCDFYFLKETCYYARVSDTTALVYIDSILIFVCLRLHSYLTTVLQFSLLHLCAFGVTNTRSVVSLFVMFDVMLLHWLAVFFLEMWKRTEVGLAYRWDVLGYEEQQVRYSLAKCMWKKYLRVVFCKWFSWVHPTAAQVVHMTLSYDVLYVYGYLFVAWAVSVGDSCNSHSA